MTNNGYRRGRYEKRCERYGGGSERESEIRQSITVNLEADSRDVNREYTAIIIYSETRFMMIIDAGCPLFDISVDTI